MFLPPFTAILRTMDYTRPAEIIEVKYLTRLSRHRADHSRRTAEYARGLAVQYGLDREKAYLAGLAHDIAKEKQDKEILEYARLYKPEEIHKDELNLPLLLHGRAAAGLLVRDLAWEDEEILDAVTWHITGKSDMAPLSKAVYCADFLEPGRTFLSDEFRREALSGDLDSAVRTVLTSLLHHRRLKKHKPCSHERELMRSLGLGEYL